MQNLPHRVLRKQRVLATDQTLAAQLPAAQHKQKYTKLEPHELQNLQV